MRLSKTSAHAALAIAHLATKIDEGPTQARQVAEHLGVPTDSALKILQTLVRHRLIRSQLGRSGGYLLQRPADGISLLEIVEAIDGPITAELPFNRVEDGLEQSVDLLHNVCEQAAIQLRRELGKHTVADLARMNQTSRLAVAG